MSSLFAGNVSASADEYTLCSVSSSNDTEDDLVGPGRTLGHLYEFLGRRIEYVLGLTAEKLLHRGPRRTAQRIKAIYRDAITDIRIEYRYVELPNSQYLACVEKIRKKCKLLECCLW